MMRFLSCTLLTMFLLAGCSHETDPEYIAEIDTWHEGRIERLQQNDGWLTLVGLHPLKKGTNSLGARFGADVVLHPKAPERVGDLTVTRNKILLTVRPDVEVTVPDGLENRRVYNVTMFPDDPGPPTIVSLGPLRMYVISRGDKYYLRVKDTEAEVLQSFEGIDRFAVDDRWRVEARIVDGPATMKVPNVLGQTEEVPSPGFLEFTIKGKSCRLQAQGEKGKRLFIVFGDNTNGKTTYSGGRFLTTDPAAEDGTVILDFNRAYNPPCVFTPYATCPLPSIDNLLDVSIEAGEKMWGEGH